LILKKQFKVGDRLPSERKLATIFNVSRVVIKQALLALEYSGFIETSLGSKGGAFVKFDLSKPLTIFLEDIRHKDGLNIGHFSELRRILECNAIRSAVKKADDRDIERLVELNEAFGKRDNRERFGELNAAFHVAIAEIAGNPVITNILTAVMDLITIYPGSRVSDTFIRRAYDDHKSIIEAIKQRDVDLAEKFQIRNIERIPDGAL
jgi:GntR family transcriptional repressor for pyruvate dehydrogenase complex